MICAGEKGKNLCNGHYGSGFYEQINRRWRILGVVSVSENLKCSQNEFLLLTNVVNYVSWINGKKIIHKINFKFSNLFLFKKKLQSMMKSTPVRRQIIYFLAVEMFLYQLSFQLVVNSATGVNGLGLQHFLKQKRKAFSVVRR